MPDPPDAQPDNIDAAAETALQENQRALSTLMGNLPGAAYRCRNDPDWSMLFLSPGFKALTGYDPEYLVGGKLSYRSRIHDDDRERVWDQVQASLQQKSHFQLVYRFVCANGDTKWIWDQGVGVFCASGELEALEGFLSDFTEQKKALDLAESQAELLRIQERAMNACVNGVLITDFRQPDNPIIYTNEAIQTITGYPKDEIIGSNCRILQRGDAAQDGLRELRAAVSEGLECRVVIRNYRKDGTLFWNELAISPIRNEEGEVTHFLGIQVDVTERRANEEGQRKELAEVQEALRRSERLTVIGQLTGGVAHELRSPLSVIQNAFLYIDETTQDPDQDTSEALDEIRRGIAGAERVIAELLDYGRDSKSAKQGMCSLQDVVGDALQHVVIPSSVELEIHTDHTEPSCYCDRDQIGRLVHNLVKNGIQAMPKGGRLEIFCRAEGDNACIEVGDTGTGIHECDLEKIFQPLVSKKAKGIGLGLTISRRYAEQNEGTLDAESTLGKGSVFRLTLPSGA
ncbi:MAG: PAS domain S-box-containing protein [Verrucomicrobiales bacterium]|jgi:PAS domain S-box-containing protein